MITITDAAKNMITQAMKRMGKDAMRVGLVTRHCGGKGLDIALIQENDAKRKIEVNGLAIDISEEDEAFLNGFLFDAEGNNLKVVPPEDFQPSSCSSCHEDCEGECGCGAKQ